MSCLTWVNFFYCFIIYLFQIEKLTFQDRLPAYMTNIVMMLLMVGEILFSAYTVQH